MADKKKDGTGSGGTETYVTASGLRLTLIRPSAFDAMWFDRQFVARRPKPPKKKVETAFGIEEIDNPEDETFQAEMAAWTLEYGHRIFDFYLLEYVRVEGGVPDSLPDIERTYARMRRAGVEPPYDLADEDGRKLAYLHANLNQEESVRLQLRLRQMMRPSEEVVSAVEESFRGALPGSASDG